MVVTTYRHRNAHKGQDRGAHLIRRPPGVDANLAAARKTTDPSLMCCNEACSDWKDLNRGYRRIIHNHTEEHGGLCIRCFSYFNDTDGDLSQP